MRRSALLLSVLVAAACGESTGASGDGGRCDVILATGRCAPDDDDDDDDGVPDLADCAPLDPAGTVELATGECATDDEDDDDDGARDGVDCAPRDPRTSVPLESGACAADDEDDDDDGVADADDCAPRDSSASTELTSGECVADDDDDDDDGVPDPDDCAPRDPQRSITVADGGCAADDEDDDDDGVLDEHDCAALDPAVGVELADGTCAPNDDDDDDDGADDASDCAPDDASRAVTLADGACVADDEDDDDDGAADLDDCAPLDAERWIELTDGACRRDDEDDDDDGTADGADCAPLDPGASVALATGACVPDDTDDDDDGAPDATDCAPLDPALMVALTTGACVADDDDDDDDGAADAADCGPRDPTVSVALTSGECVPNDSDDDDDGAPDADDCAPLDRTRQVLLVTGACVADDADDDDDGADDGADCSPRDVRYSAGPCAPGAVQTRACGSDTGACQVGERTRVCRESCYYGPWGECGGAHVAATTELCGTGVDEDCDGSADEGCECSPTPPGAPGSFPVAGQIRNMRADPVRCLAYGMDIAVYPDVGAELVVFDTRLKTEVVRIPYGDGVVDYDISPDAARIAVARRDIGRIEIIEPPVWTPVRSYVVEASPRVVEIGTTHAFFATRAGVLYTVDLATGANLRTVLAANPMLELSPDETSLYAGSFASSSWLRRYDVNADGSLTYVDRTDILALGGLARGQPLVSPDGTRVSWAGNIFDAFDLRFSHGNAGWHLDAWDSSSRFMAAGGGLADADRVRQGAPHWSSEATILVSSDQEVWWHDEPTGMMHYGNVGDFLDPADLGRREWAPLPLADYDFTSLVSDPVRPWLYAVDEGRGEVVVFDRATLTPLTAIEVGIVATDAAIDPSGRYLYTGHYYTWGVARVDLDELTYAGLARTHVRPTDIVALRPGRVVAAGDYSWQNPALIDTFAGTVLDQTRLGYTAPRLATRGDGTTLYVAETMSSGNCFYVFDTSAELLTEIRRAVCSSIYSDIATVPATTDVFWALTRVDTESGTVAFSVPETILNVTPDGLLAISMTSIYDATTGALRAALPATSAAQALSPDGRTLYVARPGARPLPVDLGPFLP